MSKKSKIMKGVYGKRSPVLVSSDDESDEEPVYKTTKKVVEKPRVVSSDDELSEEEDEDSCDSNRSKYKGNNPPLITKKAIKKPVVMSSDDESDCSIYSIHSKKAAAVSNKVPKIKYDSDEDSDCSIASKRSKKAARPRSPEPEFESDFDSEEEEVSPKQTKSKINSKNVIKDDEKKIKFVKESNILMDDHDKIMQPKMIKTQLMNHQRTMVKKMIDIERNGEILLTKEGLEVLNEYSTEKEQDRYYYRRKTDGFFGDIDDPDEIKIKTDFAIYGDMVGAGKTLDIVTLLTINDDIKENEYRASGNEHYTITTTKKKINTEIKELNVNLLIVPSKILFQWKKAFEDNSALKLYSVGTEKEINNLLIQKYDDIKTKIVENYEEIEYRTNNYNNKKRDYDKETKVFRYFDEYEGIISKGGKVTWNQIIRGRPTIHYHYGHNAPKTNALKYSKYDKVFKDVKFKDLRKDKDGNITNGAREIILDSKKLVDTKISSKKWFCYL